MESESESESEASTNIDGDISNEENDENNYGEEDVNSK